MSALNKVVMVLNKSWMPIRIVPTYRAITLVFAGKASAIDVNDWSVYDWKNWSERSLSENPYGSISTSSCDIEIPEIIVLSTYNKVFRKDVRLTKRNIYIRDGYRCQYTGKQIKESDADIDHVKPRSKGGANSWSNMVVCTKAINRMKADRTPEQAGLKLIRKPKKPDTDRMLIDPKVKILNSWNKFIKSNK
jgi:5-methylcytosine-specific restriction endonuclease McrA